LAPGNKLISLERNGPQGHVARKIQKKNMSEDSPDKIECSRRSRARARLRASKRGNFVGNQRFLKRYVGRKTKGDNSKTNESLEFCLVLKYVLTKIDPSKDLKKKLNLIEFIPYF
jgi:hypothetical protein